MEYLSLNSYKELIIWQKAMDLVVAVYGLTNQYPKEELYGLIAHTKKNSDFYTF